MRDLTKLLDAILEHIPKDDDQQEFRRRLEYTKKKILYTAPEVMADCWIDAEQVINAYLPAPAELNEWQTNVVNLWTGKTTI